jgi:predicted RNase H-like HicB family nuclease
MIGSSDMLAEATLHVLVTPAEDIPGQWVAHCLNLDVVTAGESIEHALEMAREAVLEVVADDLKHDLNPLDRASAPTECWEIATAMMHHGTPLANVADRTQIRAVLAQLQVLVPRAALPSLAQPPVPLGVMAPPAWQIAALSDLRGLQQARR